MESDPFQSASHFVGDSIERAKDYMRAQFNAGVITDCPCCGQTVKKYARAITKSMVLALRYIAHHPGCTPNDITSHSKATGDPMHAKLIHWGLLEQRNGGWHCTPLGYRFLQGGVTLAKYSYIYNAKCFGYSEEVVTVYDCAGKDFSYNEVMDPNNVAPQAEPKKQSRFVDY